MDLYQRNVRTYTKIMNQKTRFIILQKKKKKIPQLLFCSSNGSDRFHCHAIKKKKKISKSKTNQWKKLRNCDVRYRR